MAPVMGRITINGTQSQFSCKRSIPLTMWDEKGDAFVTAEMVRNSYQGFGSEYETLLGAFDKDIANLKRRVGKDSPQGTDGAYHP